MGELATNAAVRSAPVTPDRFAFGENWNSFLTKLDESRITEAEKALQWLLGRERLDGQSFADIGSGSGLMSLAARRLGARVMSFDYDPQSVECTAMLRGRFFPNDSNWTVERGSALDRDFMGKLGRFDIAYSWGVLHHTGAMYEAIENASRLVAPGGLYVVALYRKTLLCGLWTVEKRWYCQASPRAQAIAEAIYMGSMRAAFTLTGRDFGAYEANYLSNRGMDLAHNVRDWLGGYPYESIRPADAGKLLSQLGFEHVRSKVQPYSVGLFGSGCDEFVYRRVPVR
jgi:2-polyprenyl-3-methyl-5-hydroxy-6-metoxy-1,4-benzoquinol methylase